VAAVVALGGALLAWAMMSNLAQSTPAPDASVIVVGRNPLMDQSAPNFTLQTVDGKTVSLADLRGKPVIVNFWASWCVPCREEFPLLVSAYARYSGQGLQIVGVIHDDGPQTATDFAKTYGATWPLVLDPGDSVWRAYNGALVPISYFIDRSGVVRVVSYGPPAAGFMDQEIAKIL
jgi:cytochrome c biogenesis protein CcmG, thiol:disulfide interchange protein DsbE